MSALVVAEERSNSNAMILHCKARDIYTKMTRRRPLLGQARDLDIRLLDNGLDLLPNLWKLSLNMPVEKCLQVLLEFVDANTVGVQILFLPRRRLEEVKFLG
jgi:hypothetical protein